MRRALVALALVASCKKPPPPEITGTLVIQGKDVSAQMRCQPGAAVHIFVDIETPEGTLRFEDQKLSLNGEVLACNKLDRAWNGARRPNNTAYWRGTLAFECSTEVGAVRGDLDLACGGITLEEQAALDRAKADLDAQKRRNAANPGSAAPVGSGSGSGSN